MADHTVHSTSSVAGLSGFAGRAPNQPSQRSRAAGAAAPGGVAADGAGDRAFVHPVAAIALRLLRERVLARTRRQLELDDSIAVPLFAELVEGEPVPEFLGRLLSAQNQLAGRRAGVWPGARIRQGLVLALHEGANETVELLTADGEHVVDAVAVVFEVLAEFGRRVAALGETGAPAAS